MYNVAILGASGMLGSQLSLTFHNSKKFNIYLSSRKSKDLESKNYFFFDASKDQLDIFLNKIKVDYIVNCIGVIKPLIDVDPINSIMINSIFPHRLSEYCFRNKIKLIHITTDCVFSGTKGCYTENIDHDCVDLYGKTKSLGEPKNCMVIRTSIIGKEKYNFLSLVSWLLNQKNKIINGFDNHLWNGLTTKYFSEILINIIDKNLYKNKTIHFYSPNNITKYDLLCLLIKKFNLNIEINKIQADQNINRTLSSQYNLSKELIIKDIDKQIKEM